MSVFDFSDAEIRPGVAWPESMYETKGFTSVSISGVEYTLPRSMNVRVGDDRASLPGVVVLCDVVFHLTVDELGSLNFFNRVADLGLERALSYEVVNSELLNEFAASEPDYVTTFGGRDLLHHSVFWSDDIVLHVISVGQPFAEWGDLERKTPKIEIVK